MLQPSSNWFWFVENDSQMLSLELDDLVFSTGYHQKRLLPHASTRQPFSIDDHEFYSKTEETLGFLPAGLSEAKLTQIALNATAVKRFYKPIMPKSWYFTKPPYSGHNHGFSLLENDYGQGRVLIIEKDATSSLCMLIEQMLQLDTENHLEEFAVIKVMNDYLAPYLS